MRAVFHSHTLPTLPRRWRALRRHRTLFVHTFSRTHWSLRVTLLGFIPLENEPIVKSGVDSLRFRRSAGKPTPSKKTTSHIFASNTVTFVKKIMKQSCLNMNIIFLRKSHVCCYRSKHGK